MPKNTAMLFSFSCLKELYRERDAYPMQQCFLHQGEAHQLRNDGIGNRLSLVTTTDGTTQTQNYQYDANSHRLSAIAGERTFSYDAVGNTTNNGNATFTYNERNRMSSASANGVTTSYEINALGQRVRKSSSAGETQFIYDLSGRLIAEADAACNIQVEYAYLDGEPLAIWREGPGLATPTLDTPVDQSTLTSGSEVFNWRANNATVDEWWLYVGSSVGGKDYYDSANLLGVTSAQVSTLPTDGTTVHARLWFRETAGAWSYVDSSYTAPSIVSPSFTTLSDGDTLSGPTQSIAWSNNGTAVAQWWLYVGSTPGGTDYLDSHNLYAATSIVVSTLPNDGSTVYLKLWYREAGSSWQSTSIAVTAWTGVGSLLVNGGFESGISHWLSCANVGTTTTSTDATQGSASLAISGSDCLYQEFAITPGTSYTVQCDAKATGYASLTLSAMDANYTELESKPGTINSSNYQNFTASITAPTAGAIGALTFYGEGTANFDACTVVEGQ